MPVFASKLWMFVEILSLNPALNTKLTCLPCISTLHILYDSETCVLVHFSLTGERWSNNEKDCSDGKFRDDEKKGLEGTNQKKKTILEEKNGMNL